jgi:hypothetical protein
MHMLLFDIVPLQSDACLVLVNELLYPFEKGTFWLPTKPHLHRLLNVTMWAEPVLHMLNVSRRSSLIKASTLWMCWSVRDVDGRPDTCSFLLKAFYPLVDLSLMHGVCSILCQHPAMDFRRLNPLCPQKMHYGALFLDGSVAEWSGHTSTLVSLCHMIERWNVTCS